MLDPIADDIPWEIITEKPKAEEQQTMEPTKMTSVITNNTPIKSVKRKEITPQKEHRQKICKTDNLPLENTTYIDTHYLTPYGTIWHQNSCAYDAVLCIIHAIWVSNKEYYTHIFKSMNDEIMGNLAVDFAKHASGCLSLESARDNLRRYLHQTITCFQWGQFTSASQLLEYMLSTPTITVQAQVKCKNNHIMHSVRRNNTCYLVSAGTTHYPSVSEWMHQMEEETNHTCASCSEKVSVVHSFVFPLPFIALDFEGQGQIQLDHSFHVLCNDMNIGYKLRGIIYFGDSHFTSRIVYDNGMSWFHDGIATGQTLVYEGIHNTNNAWWNTCRGKTATAAIYVKC
jgi:hypothetical protein